MPVISKSSQIALALAMPASVIIAYWLYSRWSSDEECYGKQKVVTSHNTKIKVTIPGNAVGTVIGKQGSTIKRIQSETGARLNFNDRSEEKDGKPRVLMISGTTEMAQKAEMLVYQVIAEMPQILSEEVQVPSYCIGRIIGKGGSTIRDLRRASGARFGIDKDHHNSGPDSKKAVVLSGSRQQIDLAMELIDEIVGTTERERRGGNVNTTATPTARYGTREIPSVRTTAVPVEEDDYWGGDDDEDVDNFLSGDAGTGAGRSKLLSAEDFLQVMVSAVEHPGHFWVQAVGPSSLHLERLQKDMTAQLECEDTRQSLLVSTPEPGAMVAAKFEEVDPVFYRARVLGSTDGGQADLYFVDYGDNAYADCDKIYHLRPEFVPFPHQAVQCQLADVEPASADGWTDAGITAFEDLVFCAQWKPLYAKTLTYTRIVSGHTGQGEGQDSLRPCLQLVDTSGHEDVDVAEELIRRGHAMRLSSAATTPPSPRPIAATTTKDS